MQILIQQIQGRAFLTSCGGEGKAHRAVGRLGAGVNLRGQGYLSFPASHDNH